MKLSLQVVPPPRKTAAAGPPGSVQLSEPMLRFHCNQKGCCCSGWDIPFRLEDFLRLHQRLPEAERAALGRGIELVLEEKKAENGERILHALKLDGVGEDRACRFLSPGGTCGVHERHGLSALPDLCVDFPAFGYRRADARVELWFDPVCPEVLEQLDESDEPLRLHFQRGSFHDAGLDLRVEHTDDEIGGRLGPTALDPSVLDAIRAAGVAAFAHPTRPVWRTVAAVVDAFRRLRPGNENAFEVVEPEDPRPFLLFLESCIAAHGAGLLAATLRRYRRFIWAIDPAPLAESPSLVDHLRDWHPAFAAWLAPQEALLRPLLSRWLAHRFGTPMVAGQGELRQGADVIVHLYGTALRCAAGFGAALRRPVDRDLMKVAIGTAEFFYRSMRLPREALPWFAGTA